MTHDDKKDYYEVTKYDDSDTVIIPDGEGGFYEANWDDLVEYVQSEESEENNDKEETSECCSNSGKMPLHLLAIQQNYTSQFHR
jgi:hypothetical protein